MELRCFGGPLDGRFWSVENDRQQGALIRIPEYPRIASAYLNDPIAAPDTIDYYEYVVEQIRTSKMTWKFLRYNQVTIEEIFTKVFT